MSTATAPIPLCCIVAGVVHVTGVSRAALAGRSQLDELVTARQMAAAIGVANGHALPTIGRALGRDHTTVLSGARRHREIAARRPDLQALAAAAERAARALAAGGRPEAPASSGLHPALTVLRRGRTPATSQAPAARPLPLAPADSPCRLVLRGGTWQVEGLACAGS